MVKNDFAKCNDQWGLVTHLLYNNWTVVSDNDERIYFTHQSANAFLSPCKTKVLRVNKQVYKDFALYVDMARAHPDNPYFQNIGDDFFLDDGTYCVELEPLFDEESWRVPLKAKNDHSIILRMLNRPFKKGVAAAIDRRLQDDPDFKNAMGIIYATIERACGQHHSFDLPIDTHGGNIMIRHNDEIVITDPFTYYNNHISEEYLDASHIFWRRKLGFLDHKSQTDWDVEYTPNGTGALVPKP
jgi:hypothetical protein